MVLLFAHRGGTDHDHPENSIAAMARTLELGLSPESDIRLSADGIPVLVHDPYVRGGSWFPRRVRRLTAARLARYGVPALADLYRELGSDFELSIDVKDPEAVRPALDVAANADATRRLWLVHDSIHTLHRIRRASHEVRLVHETRLPDLDRRTTHPFAHMDQLVTARIDAQNTHWSRWTPELVDAAHQRGLLAFGSIAQRRVHMQKALEKGLDALYTDFVQDLADVARAFRAAADAADVDTEQEAEGP